MSHDLEDTDQYFVQPQGQGQSYKAGICDGVPSTAV